MIEQIIHQLKIRQTELQITLANGGAVSWDAYQRLVGEHQGVQFVLDRIDAMLEEDEQRNLAL
jgi:hypothetical protein